MPYSYAYEVASSILGCTLFSLPMKYLSLPLRAPFKFKSIWDGVIEKIDRRLARVEDDVLV